MVPAIVNELGSAIRSQPLKGYYLRPMSTLARAVQRVGPERRYRRSEAAVDAGDDMALVRYLALATSVLFIAIAVGPLWISSSLSSPWDLVACVVGATVAFVPAAVVIVSQLTARFARPHRLLERVASTPFGQRLDAIVWWVSVAVGVGLGCWLSTT